MKNWCFIVLALLIIVYVIYAVRKNKLSVKQSFEWIFFSLLILFFAIFPRSLDWLSIELGISYPPALFLTLAVVLLFLMNFNFAKKIDELEKKVLTLSQELSIIKDKYNDDKK